MSWEVFWTAMGAVALVGISAISAAFAYGVFRGRADEASRNQKEALSRAFADIKELNRELHHSHQVAERGERIAEAVRAAMQEQNKMPPSDTQVGRDGRGVRIPGGPLAAPPYERPISRPPPPPPTGVLKKP